MFYRKFYPAARESNPLGSFMTGCLTGLVIGVAVGVLTAPHRGSITRRKLTRRAGETRDQILEAVEALLEERFGGKKEPTEEETESEATG